MMAKLTPFKSILNQKFRKFDLVKVDVISPHMNHFSTNFYGIVAYSYREKYGGSNNTSYSIIKLNTKLTKAVNQISWYNDADLKLSKKLSRKQINKILEDLKWIDI